MKLHLTAKVPNEGARLLAQWVMHRHGGDLFAASAKLIVSPIVIQRIIAGEITPGVIIGGNLFGRVGIVSGHFARLPLAGWFDGAAMSDRAAA